MSLKLVFVHCAFPCFKETEEQLPQILKQAEMNVTNREETKKNRESSKNPEGKPTNSASPTVLHVMTNNFTLQHFMRFIYSWDNKYLIHQYLKHGPPPSLPLTGH